MAFFLKQGLTMLSRLALNFCTQGIFLSQPAEKLGQEAHVPSTWLFLNW